ncbi:MAG TPA: CHAT domain-containing protein [Pyrinomonadaceae bacterium]
MGGTKIVQEPNNQLIRYLLGELDEPEEEQVELRLLTDPNYAEEFDGAVNDVIDRYVAGEFQGPQLERVRSYFFKSRERQEKLGFALALKRRKSQEPSFHKQQRKPLTWYLAAAASILVIIGIGFVAWYARRPQSGLDEGLVALQGAFHEERPIEGRLSDFNYVPLPNQRGGTGKVDYVQRDLASTLLLKSVRDNPTAASHHAAAKYYLMLHQFDQADKEFAAALALDPQNAKIHNDFGAALLEEARSQTSSANNNNQLELYGRSLEQIQKALELDNSLLEAHFNRALIFQAMRPSEQAKAAWEEYLQKDSNSPWADEARRNIKLIEQQQRGSSTEGNDKITTFLAALGNSDDSAAWKVISASYTSAGNEITNHFIDCLLGVEPVCDHLDTSTTLAGLTYVARLERDRAGDRFTSDLVRHYERAGPELKPTLAKARYHMQTAYASFQKSQFREAITEYTKAKLKYEQAEDSASEAFVEYRLAHCYVLLPDPQEARLAFNRLLIICEKNQYRWLAAQCLYGLAHANGDASEYSKALKYSAEALTRLEQVGDTNGALKCLTQLADFNEAINQIPTALGYLSRSLELAETSALEPRQLWTILTEIGFSLGSLKLPAGALFYHQEALQLARELGIPLLISRSASYVGTTYAAMGMYPEAVKEATQAFEIGRNRGDRTGTEMMAQASLQLGDINREAGKCDEALTHYDYSLQLYQHLNFDYHAYVAHKGKLHCFLLSSNNQAVRDELLTVLKLSELYRKRITEERQRLTFFDAEQEVYDVAIDYEFSVENNYVKALEYSEQSRARSLLDAVEGGRRKSNARDLDSPIVTSPLSVAEIQKRLPARSQIVQYAVLDSKLIVWVVTQTKVEHEEIPIKAPALVSMVNAFLNGVNQPPTVGSYKPDQGSELYRILIQPIERYLDRGQLLLIVPDKVLNYLPFAALTSPTTSHYLIEDYDLCAAASGTLFVNLSAAAERKSGSREEFMLSIGDPSFDRGLFKSLRELPATLHESKAVAELYPKHSLLVREQATEAITRAELEKSDVAHLAMHFVLNEQSEMLSGFPLTPETSNSAGAEGLDGFLQSYEICSLNLRRLRLVILSACQTGIERQYRGEGAVGAARPFFVAGVPTVVASLWPVDSDASAELMVKFHQHRRDGLRVTQALQQAQLEMIRGTEARYRHPYYWAPFVTIGGITNPTSQ